MGTLSAADILQSAEFFEASEKTKRYIHHRFQDYGYRLAEKLGDLQHRTIYMGLAKNEDHNMLERALSFALDYYDQPNKGKLFMWKLKQLRQERWLKQAKNNFGHDFVMETMAKTYDSLAQAIYSKQKSRLDSERESLLHSFASKVMDVEKVSPRAHTKLLDLGVGAGVDSHVFSRFPLKGFGFEISRNLADLAKKHCHKTEIKVIRKKHFLEHSYKPQQFQGVWIDRFWQVIPLESEPEYFVECFELLQPGGYLALTVKKPTDGSETHTQGWQEIQWQEQTLLTIHKANQIGAVIEQAVKLGFDFIEDRPENSSNTSQHTTLVFQKPA